MKNFASVLALFALAPLMCLTAPRQAAAHPQYLKAFSEKYGANEKIKAAAEEKKCGICHGEGGKNKKVVSDYAKALSGALGEKKVKSAEKIEKALTEIDAKKPEGSDKTYGEMLKEGVLPKPAS